MKIVGCDLHANQQSIAMVDTETGEFTDSSDNRSEEFIPIMDFFNSHACL